MIIRYPELQSGFVALNESGLVRPKNEPQTFSETILFQPKNKEYVPYFYSENVTTIFNQFRADPHILSSFDFKERILKAAFQNFGPSLADWMYMQAHKPSFSSTHAQFLEKMIPWTMEPLYPYVTDSSEAIRWLGILGPCSGNNEAFPVGEIMSERFFHEKSVDITRVAIHNWVRREGGYESLISYLFTIFGERTGHLQVPPKSVS